MPGITLSFGFDEVPADGEKCHVCGQIITGEAFYPYTQVGEPGSATHLAPWCRGCYEEKFGKSEKSQ